MTDMNAAPDPTRHDATPEEHDDLLRMAALAARVLDAAHSRLSPSERLFLARAFTQETLGFRLAVDISNGEAPVVRTFAVTAAGEAIQTGQLSVPRTSH